MSFRQWTDFCQCDTVTAVQDVVAKLYRSVVEMKMKDEFRSDVIM